MTSGEAAALAFGALRAHRVRTRLTYAAVAIGVASVLVLTALGTGARQWIVERFATLGSNVLIVIPGRTDTRGAAPLVTTTTRDLTLEDLDAVVKRARGVQRAVPIIFGEAPADVEGRRRAVTVVGTTQDFLRVRGVSVERGAELPDTEARVCLIGRTVRRELFGEANPLGARIRIGEYPYRVIGLIAQRGTAMMMNVDDLVIVPVEGALRMLNRRGLFRMLVQVAPGADLAAARRRVTEVLRERHDGEEDFTILTPGAVASSLAGIVGMITAALAAIAAVSLAVAGIGVMNVMVVSVTERRREIGLMKAVGASNAQVMALFLAEAVILSLLGGAIGTAGGFALTRVARWLYPEIPFGVPGWAVALALGISASVGVTFGLMPAMRAARLEPLDALRRRA